MHVTLEDRLAAIAKTSRGIAEVESMIERGDFLGDDLEGAKRWVAAERKRMTIAFRATPEGVGQRQAIAAERSLWLSGGAIVISLVALVVSIVK